MDWRDDIELGLDTESDDDNSSEDNKTNRKNISLFPLSNNQYDNPRQHWADT